MLKAMSSFFFGGGGDFVFSFGIGYWVLPFERSENVAGLSMFHYVLGSFVGFSETQKLAFQAGWDAHCPIAWNLSGGRVESASPGHIQNKPT